MIKIAVIGAGVGGLTLAQNLSKQGFEVVVFEKARGVGGRASTRKAEPFNFDHGAQCFTARTREFLAFLEPYLKQGVVKQWSGKVINLEIGKKDTKRLWYEKHLVACPTMSMLCKELAKGLDIKLATEVAPIKSKLGIKHELFDISGNNLGSFDWVICTAPPIQTANLIPSFANAANVNMHCCFALMLGYNKKWDKAWIAAKAKNNIIKWISIDSTKPDRNNAVTSIVVHGANDWSDINVDTDQELIKTQMHEAFMKLTGIGNTPDYISLHRWKYSILAGKSSNGAIFDESFKLAAVSDWSSTSRIEDVWIGANNLANIITQSILEPTKKIVLESPKSINTDSNQVDISEIIALAWDDKVNFANIKQITGLNEKEVIKTMRNNLKPSSYKLWRKRLGRSA
jgi:uncharacterized protein (TIGR03643 family)